MSCATSKYMEKLLKRLVSNADGYCNSKQYCNFVVCVYNDKYHNIGNLIFVSFKLF